MPSVGVMDLYLTPSVQVLLAAQEGWCNPDQQASMSVPFGELFWV